MHVDSLPSVGLTQVPSLLDRMDRKYLVPSWMFSEFIAQMGDRLRVLEIDGQRSFRYDSVYFDTPNLLTYQQHVRLRPRRYKVRTRAYLDSGDCMLEVKLNRTSTSTVKRRMPLPLSERTRLTHAGAAFVDQVVARNLRLSIPVLEPTLRTLYRRTTFVSMDGQARYTCDTGLRFTSGELVAYGPDDHILVEVKTIRDCDPADRVLQELGAQRVTMSKYLVAIALLWPASPSESPPEFDPALLRSFQRVPAAAPAECSAGMSTGVKK